MLDDSTIISRCQAGQLALSEILIHRYKKPLYSFCCKLARDRGEVDDLFQDTWVKAIKNINRCAPERRFITWLFTICINLYRDSYRYKYRWMKVIKSYFLDKQKEKEMGNLKSSDVGPDERIIKNEQEITLRKALKSLKDIYRIPVILYYYREFSIDEISNMLVIPKGTVKSRLAAGRENLKKIIEVMENEGKKA